MTPDSFHREMIGWLVGQGLVLISLVTGLVRWLLSREEERLISRMESIVSDGMQRHDAAPHAHRVVVEAWESARDKRLDAILLHVGDRVSSTLKDAVTMALSSHNSDIYAHSAAADHCHGPISVSIDRLDARLDGIERKLDDLMTEHRLIAGRCVAENRLKGRQ